jgi:hypothetical protein
MEHALLGISGIPLPEVETIMANPEKKGNHGDTENAYWQNPWPKFWDAFEELRRSIAEN